MQQIKTISLDCWPDIDRDAQERDMDRSSFIKYLYTEFKKKTQIKFEHIALTLILVLLLVILTYTVSS